MMTPHPGLLARNIRVASGAHLVALEDLAESLNISRSGLMSSVQHQADGRTTPRAGTLMRLASAFGVGLDDLLAEHESHLLRALAESYDAAPVRAIARVPEELKPDRQRQ